MSGASGKLVGFKAEEMQGCVYSIMLAFPGFGGTGDR
jgi:hypothetical protein